MATIYLSSTYEDLKDYRREVFETLRKAGHDVIGMEEYVAADRRPVDQCLADVANSDTYVGLFAFRYGYIPPAHHNNANGLSITELEFRHGEALNKPCLTFVVNDTTAWPRSFDDARTAEDKGERINVLRQYLLTERLASTFTSPHELSALVLAAVTKHLEGKQKPETPREEKSGAPPAVIWNIKEKGSPYPGLWHFTRKYAPVFFGRDLEVREILDRLREPEGRFLIVSGDSGVGKSSLVDAGILPKLEERGLPNGGSCESVRMLPSQAIQPFGALMAALGSLATRAGLRPDAILEELNQAPDTLGGHIKAIINDGTERQTLMLFIDQMEELFTSQDVEQANTFLTALYHAVQENALWVIATIRSDHLQYCYRHSEMVKVLRGRGHYPLGRVEPYMMRDMILKPAQCSDLRISEQFATRLIHDTGADSANLPLLAFVLNQLFENRSDRELSETEYNRLGGVTGAIEAHVKTVEEKIRRELDRKTEGVLPKVFQTLAKVQKEEGIPTRNRSLISDFEPDLQKAVDLLVRGRLLHTEGEGEAATVSISHEKLFEAWPALREYVETNKKVLVDRTLLESRARKWEEMGRPWLSGLATGREFQDFWRAKEGATSVMRAYLVASRRARWLMKGGLVLVILLVGGTTWLWQKGYTLDQALLKGRSVFVSVHVEPEMVTVPAGVFRQGDIHGLGESWRNPVREVTMIRFALGRHEVTFEEYDRFAIVTGRELPADQGWGRGRRPVINVSWEDAKAYSSWLSGVTGKPYRLPSESEWEYAARSGGKEDMWAGTSDEKELKDFAVYSDSSQNRTATVGSKNPNGLGLYDMSGNVWEWVEDCAHANYEGAPTDGTTWLEAQGGDCGGRVIRGGSWSDAPELLRSSLRFRFDRGDRSSGIGFRLAQDIP